MDGTFDLGLLVLSENYISAKQPRKSGSDSEPSRARLQVGGGERPKGGSEPEAN